MHSVLVVDDEPSVREMLAGLLADEGLSFECAGTASEAFDKLRATRFDVVLSDVRMPGRSGIEFVTDVRRLRPDVPVVLMTGYAGVDSAVAALRAGAVDYISKPFKRDTLLEVLRRAEPRDRAPKPELRPEGSGAAEQLIGTSPSMRWLREFVRKVAYKRASILISGESGTGKEQLARAIHLSGNRAGRRFVPINCAAIPEGLLESELFGHQRGAFTNAIQAKKGLFEVADGGTLFLDEIADMKPELQGKLLRVLQDLEIRPVGDTEAKTVDVRIIAATNRDLALEIENGCFRADLFYRLAVIEVHIPPLRDRPEDIRFLAEHFVTKHSENEPQRIASETMNQLLQRDWEGNARELENAIEHALAIGESSEIRPEDLPHQEPGRAHPDFDSLLHRFVARGLTMREIENLLIGEALNASKGNKEGAARLLGISRRTVYRRVGS